MAFLGGCVNHVFRTFLPQYVKMTQFEGKIKRLRMYRRFRFVFPIGFSARDKRNPKRLEERNKLS